MHEKQHVHAHAAQDQAIVDGELAPGRLSRTAQLVAPTHPIASGLVQRKVYDDNGVADDAEQAVAAASSSSGQPLPGPILRKFESSLGADLSHVRLHTGAESQAAAASVGARAYTVGDDIHFGAGQYDPSSGAGEHLLAHEVAHTVQQRGSSPARQNKLEVSSPGDHLELEADRAADAMVAGQTALISAAPQLAARSIFRDKAPSATANPKISFDFEYKFPNSKDFSWVKVSFAAKGKANLELQSPDGKGGGKSAPITVGPSGTTKGKGVKAEFAAQQHLKRCLKGVDFEGKGKEKLTFELTGEKVAVTVGVEVRANFARLPWLKAAGDFNFHFLNAKWEEIKKDPNAVKVLAGEVGLGLSGEGTLVDPTLGVAYKGTITGLLTATASPNWARLGAEVAKQAAKKGAETAAGTVEAGGAAAGAEAAAIGAGEAALAVDGAAVAGTAAAVIVPLGAAAMMAGGFMQMEKNIRASKAAIAMGLKMRGEARSYVKAYIATLGGGSGGGQGGPDANAKIMECMAATGMKRAAACAEIIKRNGGKDKIAADIRGKLRTKLYDKGVAEFERRFADQFGIIEDLGPTWGMRGQFRTELRGILFSDE